MLLVKSYGEIVGGEILSLELQPIHELVLFAVSSTNLLTKVQLSQKKLCDGIAMDTYQENGGLHKDSLAIPYNDDGKYLYLANNKGQIKKINYQFGLITVKIIEIGSPVTNMLVTEDDLYMFVCDKRGNMSLWLCKGGSNVDSEEVDSFGQIHKTPVWKMIASNDAQSLFTLSQNFEVKKWDLVDGSMRKSYKNVADRDVIQMFYV